MIYLKDERYIKINEKIIIGIYEPTKIPKLNVVLSTWRKKAVEYGIGELYIIVTLNHYEIKLFDDMKSIDAVYQFSPRDSLTFYYIIRNSEKHLYTATLYKEYNNNYSYYIDFYKGSMLEFDNSARKKKE